MIGRERESEILRLYHAEKWKVGTIARQLGLHHTTVRRVLAQAGVDAGRSFERRSKLEPFLPFIRETLEQYPSLPSSRLYQMAVERGYRGAADYFRSVVARYRPKKKHEAFLRLSTLPGEEAQVDWAHFGKIAVGSTFRALWAFVMVLSFSRRLFLHFYLSAKMECFLDGHVRAFEAFGGVARRNLYDNLKSVVLERAGSVVRFNQTFLDFAAHYRFAPVPVGIRRGNEKGRVERSIRFIRQSFFAARSFRDVADLNTQAEHWTAGFAAERACPGDRTRTVREVFDEEQPLLLPLPENPFPIAHRAEVEVGKTPFFRFDSNDYSVPHQYVRQTLVVLASPTELRVINGQIEVTRHERSWDRGARVEKSEHTAALWQEKRRARRGSALARIEHTVPSSKKFLRTLAEQGANLGNATLLLLRLLQNHPARELDRAIAEALARGTPHFGAIRHLLDERRKRRGQPPPVTAHLRDERLQNLVVEPHDLGTYDVLGGIKNEK